MSRLGVESLNELDYLDLSEIVAESFMAQIARPSDSVARLLTSGPPVPTTPDHRDEDVPGLAPWTTV